MPTQVGPDGALIKSQPEVLIYLEGVHDVRIEDCVIKGADFAIFGVRGGGHEIVGNSPMGCFSPRSKRC